MINVVIFGEDLNYCTSLMNYLNNENSNLKIIAIVSDVNKLKDVIYRKCIDIVLIDINDTKCIEILKENIANGYFNNIILIANQIISKKMLEQLNVYGYVINKNNMKRINYLVQELCLKKTEENAFLNNFSNKNPIVKQIEDELKFLDVKVSYRGIKYIMEAVYILYSLKSYYNNNLEKDIYPIIAKKHNITVNNIKSNINYAVTLIYLECEEKKLLDYLEEYSLYKPSPKILIFSILEKLQIKMPNKL